VSVCVCVCVCVCTTSGCIFAMDRPSVNVGNQADNMVVLQITAQLNIAEQVGTPGKCAYAYNWSTGFTN